MQKISFFLFILIGRTTLVAQAEYIPNRSLLSSYTIYEAGSEHYDLNTFSLKGKVKSVAAVYDSIDYYRRSYPEQFQFSEDGKLMYYFVGDSMKNEPANKFTKSLEYDNFGNLLSVTRNRYHDGRLSESERKIYAGGWLARKEKKPVPGRSEKLQWNDYTYRQKDSLITVFISAMRDDFNNSLTKKDSATFYKGRPNLLSAKSDPSDEEKLTATGKLQSRKTGRFLINQQGEYYQRDCFVYTYNGYDDLESYYFYITDYREDSEPSSIVFIRFEYEYDSHHNWIKKRTYNSTKLQESVSRTIVYY